VVPCAFLRPDDKGRNAPEDAKVRGTTIGCRQPCAPAEIRLYTRCSPARFPAADGDLMADLNPIRSRVLSGAMSSPASRQQFRRGGPIRAPGLLRPRPRCRPGPARLSTHAGLRDSWARRRAAVVDSESGIPAKTSGPVNSPIVDAKLTNRNTLAIASWASISILSDAKPLARHHANKRGAP